MTPQVRALCDAAYEAFGAVHWVMNNAGIGLKVGKPWESLEEAQRLLDVNLWGVIHGCHAFIPRMLREAPVRVDDRADGGFMMPCLDRSDFNILCPDGETTREMDEKRMQGG